MSANGEITLASITPANKKAFFTYIPRFINLNLRAGLRVAGCHKVTLLFNNFNEGNNRGISRCVVKKTTSSCQNIEGENQ